MLKYNFEKNVFEGDDDDMDGIDDDTIDNIDDLVDADESDKDSEEPTAEVRRGRGKIPSAFGQNSYAF